MLVFFLLSLINVILQTAKSILTVKASPRVASLVTAIAFAFYYVMLKQLTDFSILETVIVTIVSNLIGVSVAMWAIEKFKKDQLWKVSVTCLDDNDACVLIEELSEKNIGYTIIDVHGKIAMQYLFDIYCETQKESAEVKEMLDGKKVKYHYVPVKSF